MLTVIFGDPAVDPPGSSTPSSRPAHPPSSSRPTTGKRQRRPARGIAIRYHPYCTRHHHLPPQPPSTSYLDAAVAVLSGRFGETHGDDLASRPRPSPPAQHRRAPTACRPEGAGQRVQKISERCGQRNGGDRRYQPGCAAGWTWVAAAANAGCCGMETLWHLRFGLPAEPVGFGGLDAQCLREAAAAGAIEISGSAGLTAAAGTFGCRSPVVGHGRLPASAGRVDSRPPWATRDRSSP